jgi:hypothetical protein
LERLPEVLRSEAIYVPGSQRENERKHIRHNSQGRISRQIKLPAHRIREQGVYSEEDFFFGVMVSVA